MKKLLTIPLLFIGLITYAQGTLTWTKQQCYKIIGSDTIQVKCEDILPTPVFQGNVDSLCLEMETRFVETLNKWRRNHGLNELEYDYDMRASLTVPWNEIQLQSGEISHGEGYNNFKNRSDRAGIRGGGECCARNSRSDVGDTSEFFIQYKDSPPHWKILTSDDFHYISVSVLYDKETNRYYSVVNVRM